VKKKSNDKTKRKDFKKEMKKTRYTQASLLTPD
jgi:hypothetical protein